MNALGKLALAFLLALSSGLATAAAIQSVLTASLSDPYAVGGLTGFDLWIETTSNGAPTGVTSPLWSGGVTIAYDPTVLTFERFDFAFPGANTSNYTPVQNSGLCSSVLAGCVSGIEFLPGSPASPYDTEIVGGIKFGTFLFNYLGGSSPLELGEDAGSQFIFPLDGTTYPYDDKKFINTSVVPLPLAAWLMLGGLGMLGAFGFRKSG